MQKPDRKAIDSVIAEMIGEMNRNGVVFDGAFFDTIVSHGIKKALVEEDARLLAPLVEIGMRQVLRDYLRRKMSREIERRKAVEAFTDPFRLEAPHVNAH